MRKRFSCGNLSPQVAPKDCLPKKCYTTPFRKKFPQKKRGSLCSKHGVPFIPKKALFYPPWRSSIKSLNVQQKNSPENCEEILPQKSSTPNPLDATCNPCSKFFRVKILKPRPLNMWENSKRDVNYPPKPQFRVFS